MFKFEAIGLPKKMSSPASAIVFISAVGPVLLQPSEFAVRCLQCRTSGCAMAHAGCEHGGLWLWVSFDRHLSYAYKIYGYPTVPKRQGHKGLWWKIIVLCVICGCTKGGKHAQISFGGMKP